VWTAFTEAIRFVIVPLVLIDLVTSRYPQLTTSFIDNIGLYVLFLGGMITASSTLEAAHRPGTYKRLMFGLAALALVCVWVFVIFGGGVAEVIDYGPYDMIRLDLTKIVYIVLVGISLKGLLVFQTFSVGRKHEEEQARQRRVELARRRAAESKPRPAPKASKSDAYFSTFSKVEFEVTADDAIGFSELPQKKVLSPGMKRCEVCGAEAPTRDYVCRSCGAWFPSDSVE
jgi:uncharacterized membrane protein